MKADQQITDTCSCGASFGVTGQYLSDMRASHKEWLDRHTACRLSPLASADAEENSESRENEMSAADRYHAQTGLDLPAEGQSADLPRITGLDNYTLAALRKVSQEREDAIRVKLIELGWTPPGDGPSADRIEKLEQALNILCISAGIHAWGRDDSPKRQERLETLRGDIQEARFVLTGSPGWEPSSVTESRDVPPDHSGACTRNAEGECMSMHCPTCGKIWHGGGPCPAVVEAATDATCDHIYPAHGATKDIACVECGEPHPDAGTVYKVTREEGLGGPGSGGPADARRVSEGGQGPTHDDVSAAGRCPETAPDGARCYDYEGHTGPHWIDEPERPYKEWAPPDRKGRDS